jgi:AcrR family transcriptional regulator
MSKVEHKEERVRGGTRAALLRGAARLLEDRGMSAVTMRAVGEEAGVSRQAPYKHFADKKELLSVVAAGYLDLLGEQMENAAEAAGDDPLARLEAMSDCYARFALENPARYGLVFGSELRGSTSEELSSAAHAVHERFVGAVAECQEAGRLLAGDPVELSALLHAASHGAIDLVLSGHGEASKGLEDPVAITRSLIARLEVSKDG